MKNREKRVLVIQFANTWLVTDETRYATAATRDEAIDLAMGACMANDLDGWFEGEKTDCQWIDGEGMVPLAAIQ